MLKKLSGQVLGHDIGMYKGCGSFVENRGSFSGNEVVSSVTTCGFITSFYYVVELWANRVVETFGFFTPAFTKLIGGFSIAIKDVFMSVMGLFFHQIHKTYNNVLQIKLINS